MTQLFRPEAISRRKILRGAGVGLTGAGAALLFGCGGDDEKEATPTVPGEEGPPEVTTITLPKTNVSCEAPLLAAREFLEAEGFAVNYRTLESKYSVLSDYLATGEIDITTFCGCDVVYGIDHGLPIVALGGSHVVCFELWASNAVPAVADLRGKTVGIIRRDPDEGDFAFVSSVLKYVGLNPGEDVHLSSLAPGQLYGGAFDDGRFDALFGYLPESLTVRDTNQGHLILDSKTQSPWSDNQCCLVTVNRDFYEKNPIATKRATRAILKGVDRCAQDREGVAKQLFDEGWITTYIYALESMKMLEYDAWRAFDPADTVRFFALRLGDTGMITGTPDEVIKRGTDFRIFNELKQEMAFAPGAGPLRAGLLNCDTNVAGPLAWAPDVGRKRARGARS